MGIHIKGKITNWATVYDHNELWLTIKEQGHIFGPQANLSIRFREQSFIDLAKHLGLNAESVLEMSSNRKREGELLDALNRHITHKNIHIRIG